MRTEIYNVAALASDKTLNGEKLEKKCYEGIEIITKINGNYYEYGVIRKAISMSRVHLFSLQLAVQEAISKRRKKQIAKRVFSVESDKITGEQTDFNNPKNGKYTIFVDHFKADDNIDPSRMSELEIIWGNADLQGLHDYRALDSLNVVMGDIHTSNAINLEGLSNLEVVTGDIHAENLDNIEFLGNIKYLGGKVYHKGQQISYEQLKEKPKQFTK